MRINKSLTFGSLILAGALGLGGCAGKQIQGVSESEINARTEIVEDAISALEETMEVLKV